VQFGLYLLMASIPFELPGYRGSFPIEIPELTGAIFILCALVQPSRSFARVPRTVWWFFAYLIVFAIAVAVNFVNNVFGVVQLFLLLLQNMLVFWAAANIMEEETVATGALTTFGIACFLRALLPMAGIGRTATRVWTGGFRISAFGQNENNAAIFLAAGLIALLGLAYVRRARSPIRPRLLVLPLCAVIAYSAFNTGSRGGLFALVAGLAMFALPRGHGARHWVRNAAFASVLVLGMVYAALAVPVMRYRVHQSENEGKMAGRENLYPLLLEMFKEKPIIGWGPENSHYELSLRDGYMLMQRDSHNLILEVVTNSGLLGGFVFCTALFLCCAAAWRARASPEGLVPLAMVTCVLMGNMSGNWISSKLIWVVLAYAVASARRVPLVRRHAAFPTVPMRSRSAVV
jgi:O-antigen ligase